MDEYKKSLIDTINWNDIEQLHASVLEISKQCFEYKKICVTLIEGISAALLKFNNDQTLSSSLMTIGCFSLLISFIFFLCDALAYYYQRKNRQQMEKIKSKICLRHNIITYTIKDIKVSFFKSCFNLSMFLYYIIFLVSILDIILFIHNKTFLNYILNKIF